MVLLRRPEDARAYPDEELARIQQEHLAYHAGLREAGQVVTNGPVIDGPDPSLRGLTFYRTGSTARARELAEADHDAVIESLRPPIGKPNDYAPVVSAQFLKERLDAITIG